MTRNDDDAERYRILQAQKLIDLFKDAHGRPASTVQEVVQWVTSPEGRAAVAYDMTDSGKVIP